MNIPQWLEVNCTELVNLCRLQAYSMSTLSHPLRPKVSPYAFPVILGADGAGPCCCALTTTNHDFGNDPSFITNPAPWYDPLVDASAEFFGVFLDEFTATTPLTRVGATQWSKGRLSVPKRAFALRLRGFSSTLRGSNYGMAWALQVLRGVGDCGIANSCSGGYLSFFRTCDEDAQRTAYNIGVVSFQQDKTSPDVPFMCDGWVVDVVIEADVPWLFGSETLCTTSQTFTPGDPSVCSDVFRLCTPPTAICAIPTDCQPTAFPPPAPLESPLCWCEPEDVVTHCCSTPEMPQWAEGVIVFEIYAGSAAIRNARINVYPNTLGYPCPDDPLLTPQESQFWANSQPVATMEIVYIPANGTLQVDGRTHQVVLRCNNADLPGDPFVFGPSGSIWTDPVVTCAGRLCACLSLDVDHLSPDATLSITVVERELVGV